ncbi:MAG: putative DNA metabolism protein [Rubritalea sp.]|jgi:probable DNA metabolism protein
MTTTLLYDGSLNGLMTAIFTVYDRKIKLPIIALDSRTQNDLFEGTELVITDPDKAQRVWKRFISLCNDEDSHQVYCAYLSEIIGIENTIYDYLKMTFTAQKAPRDAYANSTVLKITQAAKMVDREKLRMETSVHFQLIDKEIYYAPIEPDFNVLPLIARHFKNHYADEKWVIYDLKRNFGISYNLKTVQEVQIDFAQVRGQRDILTTEHSENSSPVVVSGSFRTSKLRSTNSNQTNHKDLWNQYFKGTHIKSRNNLKLHLHYVSERDWKYLNDKV